MFEKYLRFLQGYSFVSPSVMLSNNNVISSEYLTSSLQTGGGFSGGQPVPDVPLDIQKFGEDRQSTFFLKYQLDLSDTGFLGRGAFSVVR